MQNTAFSLLSALAQETFAQTWAILAPYLRAHLAAILSLAFLFYAWAAFNCYTRHYKHENVFDEGFEPGRIPFWMLADELMAVICLFIACMLGEAVGAPWLVSATSLLGLACGGAFVVHIVAVVALFVVEFLIELLCMFVTALGKDYPEAAKNILRSIKEKQAETAQEMPQAGYASEEDTKNRSGGAL